MTKFIILIGFFVTSISFGQEQFIPFLKSKNLPNCFAGLEEEQIDKLVTEHEIRADWTTYKLDYDRVNEVLYLESTNHCDDIQKVHLKYVIHKELHYVYMYKERVPSSNTYGRLRLYHLDVETNEWEQGRKLEVSWQQIFSLTEKELDRLRKADQYPKYMITFKKDHISLDIPWKLYTHGEGTDNDGFSMSKGKKPMKLPYSQFLITN